MHLRLGMVVALCLFAGTAAEAKQRSYAELVAVVKGPERKYDFVDRIDALVELASFNDARAAKELVQLLDGPWAHMAAYALADIDAPAALPILIKALAHKDDWVRSLVCVAIGRIGGPKAVAALAERIDHDRDKWVRRQAVYALRYEAQRHPAGPALDVLVNALRYPEMVDSVESVLWTVDDTGHAPARVRKALDSKSADVRGFACDWLRTRKDTASTAALLKLLAMESDADVHSKALYAVAVVHDAGHAEGVVKALTQGLLGKDPLPAMRALGRVLDHGPLPESLAARVASAVHRPLRDNDPEVVRMAVILAGELGHPSSTAKILRLLASKDRHMRQAAITAVGNTMTRPAEGKALLAAIEDEDGQNQMLEAFALIRPRKAVAKLVVPALRSSSMHVRRATARLLERQADPVAADALVKALTKEEDRRAAELMGEALAATGAVRIVGKLEPLLARRAGGLEVSAAFVHLDRMQGFKASKAVIAKGGDAAIALVTAATRNVFPGDEVLFQWSAGSKDKELRRLAAEGLGQVSTASPVRTLCGLLADKEDQVMRSAARALAETRRPEAVRCLITALDRSRKTVLRKEEAARALGRLSGQRLGDDGVAWKKWAKANVGVGLAGLDRLLRGDAPELVEMAAHAAESLERNRQRRLLPALFDALDKQHQGRVRVAIIAVIGAAHATSAGPILRKELERVRDARELIARADALHIIGDDSGVQRLIAELADDRNRDRDEIAVALARITKRPYRSDYRSWSSVGQGTAK